MKLLFIYDMPLEHDLFWKDGLWAALQVLSKEGWIIEYVNLQIPRKPNLDQDFILGWGAPESRAEQLLREVTGVRKGLCFGGGDIHDNILDDLDVVFVENKIDLVKPRFKHAFGTNTDLFFPRNEPKIIDALYPAAFADWKRQDRFADICKKENLKGLVVGVIQEGNKEESNRIIDYCRSQGVGTMGWIPMESLALLYSMSKQVILTAEEFGGCQRSVLEAKASHVPVRVESESSKLLELVPLSEEEVIKEWDHHSYARKLKEGILNTLQ